MKALSGLCVVLWASVLMPAPQLDRALLGMHQQQQQQPWWLHTPHPSGSSGSRGYIVVLHTEPPAHVAGNPWGRLKQLYFRPKSSCSARGSVMLLSARHPAVQVHHIYTAVFSGFAFSVRQQQLQQQQQCRQQRLRQLLSRFEGQACAASSTVPDVLLSLAADPCVMAVYPDRIGGLRAALMASHARPAAAAAAAAAAAHAALTLPSSLSGSVHIPDLPQQQQQGVGSNVRRVRAAIGNRTRRAAAVAVAVIDTGIARHPDLPSVLQSIDCISASTNTSDLKYLDKHAEQEFGCRKLSEQSDPIGHGTMVAGILAATGTSCSNQTAAERSRGAPGVAPGTALYALHVVKPGADAFGAPFYSFSLSDVIAALQWVLLHNAQQQRRGDAAGPKIRVVNLSLGDYSVYKTDGTSLVGNQAFRNCGAGYEDVDPLHTAVCRISGDTDNGAVVVVAAGNTRQNIQTSIPDRFPEVLTVTAMADHDGLPGGAVPWSCPAGDYAPAGWYTDAESDQYAWFSNYVAVGDAGAQQHTVAAPGVCLRSTYPYELDRSGYRTESGCSFAAPAVSALVALCFGEVRQPPSSRPAKEGPCAAAFKAGAAAAVIQLLVGNPAFRQAGRAGFVGDRDSPIRYRCNRTTDCWKNFGYLINMSAA